MSDATTANMTPLGIEVVSAGRVWSAATPRGALADAIEEQGREGEAALLRSGIPASRIVVTAGRYDGYPHRFSLPDVHDLAAEFARMHPDMVNEEESANGQQTAGYKGFDAGCVGDDVEGFSLVSLGWYDAGGNIGESVLCIRDEDTPAAYEALRGLPVGTGITEILAALYAAGVEEREAV